MKLLREIKRLFKLNDIEILSVSGFTRTLKRHIEGSFSHVAVQGEVSNLRHQTSGHLYFTLKDPEAQIAAVLFKGSASKLRQPLKEGDQIVVRGELSLYPPKGNYQIIVREIEFAGIGQLLQQLHMRKLKLEQLGWFTPSKKKKLPRFPQTIGVVTSPTGSVIQDIVQVLSRRFKGFHLILNPVRVQGQEAAAEIAKAIETFNTHQLADVLIVGRGGGSLEDLWPFNEECVASAIFHSTIPIISAIGHETDFTIADFVADVRAPTPSAAAELVTAEKNQLLLQLEKSSIQATATLKNQLRLSKQALNSLKKQPPFSSPYTLLAPLFQKLDESRDDIKTLFVHNLSRASLRLEALARQREGLRPQAKIKATAEQFRAKREELSRLMIHHFRSKKESLQKLSSHLKGIDPRNLLKKGYSIVFRENTDSVILSPEDVHLGERLRIQFEKGELIVNVQEKP